MFPIQCSPHACTNFADRTNSRGENVNYKGSPGEVEETSGRLWRFADYEFDELGRELVMTRPTCATLALGTLKKGVHEHHMHKLAENAS